MCAVQCLQNGQADLGHPSGRQRPCLVDEVSQGTAAEQLHDDPRTAVILDDIVDRDDTRLVEPTRRILAETSASAAYSDHGAG